MFLLTSEAKVRYKVMVWQYKVEEKMTKKANMGRVKGSGSKIKWQRRKVKAAEFDNEKKREKEEGEEQQGAEENKCN